MDYLLRPWKTSDAAALAKAANNPQIAAYLKDIFPSPYSLQNAQDFLSICCAANPDKELFWAIEIDGSAVGSISISLQTDVHCCCAEIGYWLAQPYWGNGVVSSAVVEVCKIAFEKLPIVRIFAEVFATNRGSCRVLEKAGFVLEGRLRQSVYKQGKLLDCFVYALLKENFSEKLLKGGAGDCNL